jgi:hypothetical protein
VTRSKQPENNSQGPLWKAMEADKRIEAKMKLKDKKSTMVSTFEQALATWPIFGGTSAEGGTEVIEGAKVTVETTDDKAAGGKTEDKSNTDSDVTSKLTQQLNETKQMLENLQKENEGFKKKEEETARAQLTKEENLQKDYENAAATIERLDAVIKNVALTNAILANKDYEWHSVRQVMAELETGQYGEYDVNIDLDNGKAEVVGLDNAVKEVASKCSWLVSKEKAKDQSTAQGNGTGTGTRVRPSGTPPRPPGNQAEKTQRRAELSKRFPVIAR